MTNVIFEATGGLPKRSEGADSCHGFHGKDFSETMTAPISTLFRLIGIGTAGRVLLTQIAIAIYRDGYFTVCLQKSSMLTPC